MTRSILSLRVAAAALLAAVSVALVSCGKREGEPTSEKRTRIAGIVFQEDQFFRLVQYGMADAAGEAGVELLVGNSGGRPDKEIQLVNTYIARGVDAIVISPLSKTASATALKRARDRGVKVVTYNTTVEGDVPLSYIESSQSDLGAQTGEAARKYIEKRLGGKAKIALLAFKSQLPEQSNGRSDGFKEKVAALPGVEIVAEQDAWLPEMAVKKTGDILTANTDVDIIWAANEGGTVGAVMAVKNAGRAGKVVVFGTDISDQLIGFLLSENNVLQAVTGQKPFEIGSTALRTASRAVRGQAVAPKVSMPGVLLSREDPDAVKAYRKRLGELVSR